MPRWTLKEQRTASRLSAVSVIRGVLKAHGFQQAYCSAHSLGHGVIDRDNDYFIEKRDLKNVRLSCPITIGDELFDAVCQNHLMSHEFETLLAKWNKEANE